MREMAWCVWVCMWHVIMSVCVCVRPHLRMFVCKCVCVCAGYAHMCHTVSFLFSLSRFFFLSSVFSPLTLASLYESILPDASSACNLPCSNLMAPPPLPPHPQASSPTASLCVIHVSPNMSATCTTCISKSCRGNKYIYINKYISSCQRGPSGSEVVALYEDGRRDTMLTTRQPPRAAPASSWQGNHNASTQASWYVH